MLEKNRLTWPHNARPLQAATRCSRKLWAVGRQTLPWDYFLLARHSGARTATANSSPECHVLQAVTDSVNTSFCFTPDWQPKLLTRYRPLCTTSIRSSVQSTQQAEGFGQGVHCAFQMYRSCLLSVLRINCGVCSPIFPE